MRMQDDSGRDPTPDADDLEAAWERSLDAASTAVDANVRARALAPSDLAAESKRISGERQWLRRFRGTLRRLFPSRRRKRAEPAD